MNPSNSQIKPVIKLIEKLSINNFLNEEKITISSPCSHFRITPNMAAVAGQIVKMGSENKIQRRFK